ncbi:MAG: DAK2 domain-containing protein [Bacilli bacterium]|jgi:DAK2 domain fusion protein YloV
MKELNGLTLKEMFISGANNLYNNYPAIDALNVFPVPDGDTGMNMNLTVSSGAKEIANRNDTNIYQIAKAFSQGLLMGARGNSGVITSQIFRGFANALENKDKINAVELAEAMVSGSEVAYKAVMRPVEGTILTVIRESSNALLEKARPDWTIEKAFEFLLDEARDSLERTPDLLPVLKEVGVVDSGGAGLVTIFEGMYSGLVGEIIVKKQATAFEEQEAKPFAGIETGVEGEEYGYCTEFILRLDKENKRPFHEKRFASVLNSQGNSIVMVKDEEILKVHIHTLKPGNTLNYAQQFGEFISLKIENMSEQHNHLMFENGNGHAHASDEKKEYALITVASGDGLEELFKKYRVDYVVKGGQTMNPAAEHFIEAIKKVNAHNVFIFPNNSNIVLTANQAAEIVNAENEDVKVHIIPSKTIMQGLVAIMNFNPEGELEDLLEDMNDALSTVKTGQVTFAIKDTTIDGIEVKKDYYMGLNDKEIVCSVKDKFEALRILIEHMVDDMSSIITLICGEDISKEEAEELQEELEEKYEEIDIDLVMGNQPVYSFIVGVE